MRDKEITGLYQAYLDVYSNLNEEVEQLDESGLSQDTIRSAAKERLRRVDADYREDTPEGDKRGDKGMKKLDRTKRQLKINEPREVRMRANEEVENWVNSLIEEGYDLSEYTWDDMYEMYLDEERRDPRGRVASGPMSVYGGKGQDAGPGGSGNVNVDRMDAAQRRVKATQPKKKGMAADALFTKYSARQKGMEHGGEEGPGPKAPKRSGRSGRGANTDRGSGNAAKRRMSEDFDLFDAILEHLVAEGYADTNESALAIMANMSEEWRQSIVEEVISEGEKPFPHEKVKAKQVALRDKGSAGLERRMKMGTARRRATEAEKTGGSQQDAGKGWYHGR